MKTLYESILDDEEVLISKTKETAKDWFTVLNAMMSDPSSKERDIINMLKKDKGFEKDILSVFKNSSDVEITPIFWQDGERHIGIFYSRQSSMLMPDIEFAYCKDKSVYGNTNFVMKFNNYDMLDFDFKKNIKSNQVWSAIPSKLTKKYKLATKKSPFMVGQLFIY